MPQRTFIRQDVQIAESDVYDDTIAPTATAYETDPDNIEDDLNRLRSIANHLANVNTGNWYDAIPTPSTFEGGAQRGVHDQNQDLHDLERKRLLKRVAMVGTDVTVGGGNNFVVLGTGELPADTTAAVGAVATLGAVVAAHGGTFGTHALDEVAGANALQPKNLVAIRDASTYQTIVDSSGNEIFGLLQTENASDGHTMTDTTPNRVQISFVVQNGTADDLIACPVADIENLDINYAYVKRQALQDITEESFLGNDFNDSGSASATRQSGYDNQGTTAVDLTTNATLDLEGAGLIWAIRDDLEANLFRIVEGSAGGTSTFHIAAGVDIFDVDAIVNNFAAGISARTGGTRQIDVGVNDGVVETTAGDLEVRAAAELFFDDVNNPAGWSLVGMKFSEAEADWTTFETNFGEVSLLEALNATYAAAQTGGTRSFVQAVLTANVTAGSDINGPSTAHNNTDVDLLPYDQVTFLTDVDVYLNGEYVTKDASSGGNSDCYPGGTPADGDLAFNFNLKGTGAKPDQLTVIVNGQ